MSLLLALLLLYRWSRVLTALAARGATVQIDSGWTDVFGQSFVHGAAWR
jgi:hypothetical protein